MRVSSRFYALIGAVSVIGLIIVTADVWAGGRFFRNGAVGGVSINAEGVLSEPTVAATNGLRQFVAERLQDVPEEMEAKVSLRKISLRKLEAALQNSVDNDLGKLPDITMQIQCMNYYDLDYECTILERPPAYHVDFGSISE